MPRCKEVNLDKRRANEERHFPTKEGVSEGWSIETRLGVHFTKNVGLSKGWIFVSNALKEVENG